MVNTNRDWFPYLTGLHKGQNASKNCELFQDVPNLAELPFVRYALQSKVPMSATTSRFLQYSKYDPMLMPKILLLTRVILESFKKEKGRFFMPTFCHIFYALVMIYYTLSCFFWHNLLQRQEFWSSTTHSPRFGVKSEIYYSSVTIHCYYSLSLFTCYCSWHCSLRNFAYLRGVVPYIWSKF